MRRLLLACALAALLPNASSPQQPTLDTLVADYAKAHNFNGTILVQSKGKTRYWHSFGEANLQFHVPDTNKTKYWIASITKAFTSVLILQLEDQGRIDLGKPIAAYLPGYAGPGATRVTIHELLNHTSGIENFDQVKSAADAVANGLPNYQKPYAVDQLIDRFCSGPLVHEPGKVFDYNNGDYVILGKIIATVYGKPYEQVLQERILKPLHLADTAMLHQADIIDGLADTYFFRDDLKKLVNDLPVYPENWYAAGGLYSTATDLMTFANALFGGRLISRKSLDEMIKPGLDDYGLGVWSYATDVDGTRHWIIKRPGQIMGAQTELFHVLEPDITIVMLSNTGTTDLDAFVAEIGKAAIREAR
jgi:D-alanyl-D-alanine carboxypeptidase